MGADEHPGPTDDRRDDEPEPLGLNAAELEVARGITDLMRRTRAEADERERTAAIRDMTLALRGVHELPTVPEPDPAQKRRRDGPAVRSGGAPTEAVMTVDRAERLENVLDQILRNHHEPNISDLARRFDTKRGRIRQAIEMRGLGISLHDPVRGSGQLRTIVDSDGNVRWPSLERLRQH